MSVSMTMNGAVLPVLAMYIVAAEEQVIKLQFFTYFSLNNFYYLTLALTLFLIRAIFSSNDIVIRLKVTEIPLST